MGQNYYDTRDFREGIELKVPVRCACPTGNQTVDGVISLLTYMVTWGDSISSIAMEFGVNPQSILEANMLLQNSTIYPFTPILVPLESKICLNNPGRFFCNCPIGFHLVDGVNCKPDAEKFPIKWVAILGIYLSANFFFFGTRIV